MAIKPTGPGVPKVPAATSTTSSAAVRASTSRFEAAAPLTTVDAAKTVHAKPPIQEIAAQVAAEVQSGAVPAEQAYDVVIERAVEAELPGASPAMRDQKVLEAQLLLAENPVFRQQLRVVFQASGVVLPT